jgi:hypothetical protein
MTRDESALPAAIEEADVDQRGPAPGSRRASPFAADGRSERLSFYFGLGWPNFSQREARCRRPSAQPCQRAFFLRRYPRCYPRFAPSLSKIM